MTISVTIEPVEYTTTNGRDWECQHLSVSDEVDEIIDNRREAETGTTSGVYYKRYRVCDECDAQYNFETEEWTND